MAVGRRSLEDLREKVGVSGIIYVGNHGLEIENPVGRHNDNWSLWFKDWLHSRYYTKRASKTGAEDKVFAEGVVFYNLKRKAASQSWMAKLRRDMFDWFYSDKIAIVDYDKAGRDVTEDQEKFE
jgi:trehalose-6-phosphatase